MTPRSKTHLSRPGQNINWIEEVCDSLGKQSLTPLVDYHWANAGIRVNSSSVKGGIISSPFFILEKNPILPFLILFDSVHPNATPPIGKIHLFSKIAVAFESIMQLLVGLGSAIKPWEEKDYLPNE